MPGNHDPIDETRNNTTGRQGEIQTLAGPADIYCGCRGITDDHLSGIPIIY
jgi:hypothetical protein